MDKAKALLYARISSFAYGVGNQPSEFQLTARFENKGTDTQGIFGVADGDTFVIAFRGSEETGIADWITDLKFVKQVFPYGGTNKKVKVHFGFIQAYKSVRDAVLQAAKDTPQKNIACAGHSLGGALATLASLDIQYNLPDKNVTCYTYGSPKVGNKDFSASYNKRVKQAFRFVNQDDVIPDLPPGGFEHVGKAFAVGTKSATNLRDLGKKMEAHFPLKYIEALKKLT